MPKIIDWKYTGTKQGGNPPDAGSAFVDGVRIAWLPVDLIANMTQEIFSMLWTEYQNRGNVLSRNDVRNKMNEGG